MIPLPIPTKNMIKFNAIRDRLLLEFKKEAIRKASGVMGG